MEKHVHWTKSIIHKYLSINPETYLYIQLVASKVCKLQLWIGLYSPEQSVVAKSYVLVCDVKCEGVRHRQEIRRIDDPHCVVIYEYSEHSHRI